MRGGVGESTGRSEKVGCGVTGGLWQQGDGGGRRVLEEHETGIGIGVLTMIAILFR